MSTRFIVRLASEITHHPLPPKILLAGDTGEPLEHILLKLLAYVIFQRDRLQIEPRLHDDNIPFVPDLIQLDYELRPALWIECGETSVAKLDKLAVKASRAELWIVLRSASEIEALIREMSRCELRRNRYHLLGFDATTFDELLTLLSNRNELTLYRLEFEDRLFQIDFNGVWFEGVLERQDY